MNSFRPKEYMSVREVERVSGLRRKLIYKLIHDGVLVGYRDTKDGGWWYVRTSSLQRYAKDMGIELKWDNPAQLTGLSVTQAGSKRAQSRSPAMQ